MKPSKIKNFIPPSIDNMPKMSNEAIRRNFLTFFDSKKEWDICYKYEYPYNVLCNFSNTNFVFDNVQINSMEGFLQSLKTPNIQYQRKICELPGFMAKKVGNYFKKKGLYDGQHLFWQGKEIDRNSEEYQKLLKTAYIEKYKQDKLFRHILDLSKPYYLSHKIGKSDKKKTVLTEEEFINNLDYLRKNKQESFLFSMLLSNLILFRRNIPVSELGKKLFPLKTTAINSRLISGESVFGDEINISKLKNHGIKNIVEMNVPIKEAAKHRLLCKKNRINYININYPSHNPKFFSNVIIPKIIRICDNREKTYICANQREDANIFLEANYLFNKKSDLIDALVFGTPTKNHTNFLIYDVLGNMTNRTKKELGIKEEFLSEIEDKKNILLEINS